MRALKKEKKHSKTCDVVYLSIFGVSVDNSDINQIKQ